MVFHTLPLEILARILQYLEARDLASAAQVCRTFHRASQIESVWRYRCRKDFAIHDLLCDDIPIRDIYTKILYRYGWCLGPWQLQVSPYGGLLVVKFCGEALIASGYFPPVGHDIYKPLLIRPMFKISLDGDGSVVAQCVGGIQRPHEATLEKKGSDKFVFRCCSPKVHQHSENQVRALVDWTDGQMEVPKCLQNNPISSNLWRLKFQTFAQHKFVYEFKQLEMPKPETNVPIQPGLFKGTYDAHGFELILLTYDSSLTAKAIKVSGDPNVPAGELTFQVNMRFPMVLTAEQQTTITDLESIELSENLNKKFPAQPFVVPNDCSERFYPAPSSCTARYHGVGQIAETGFAHSALIRGHWIIFNEDLFGFIWLELYSLSMYHRVQEEI